MIVTAVCALMSGLCSCKAMAACKYGNEPWQSWEKYSKTATACRDCCISTQARYRRHLQLTNCGSAGDAEFLANDIRVKKGLDGLGCLGDMGWYCVRAALWAYGFEKPVSVSAHAGKTFAVCVITSLATQGPDLHCLLSTDQL